MRSIVRAFGRVAGIAAVLGLLMGLAAPEAKAAECSSSGQSVTYNYLNSNPAGSDKIEYTVNASFTPRAGYQYKVTALCFVTAEYYTGTNGSGSLIVTQGGGVAGWHTQMLSTSTTNGIGFVDYYNSTNWANTYWPSGAVSAKVYYNIVVNLYESPYNQNNWTQIATEDIWTSSSNFVP